MLLDNWATIETHSIFFETLKQNGHSIMFEMVSPAPQIKYYEEFYFDNIILMAPSVRGKVSLSLTITIIDLKSPISNKDLIEFLEANHNMMIFLDTDSRKSLKMLANEFGVDFENVVSYIIILKMNTRVINYKIMNQSIPNHMTRMLYFHQTFLNHLKQHRKESSQSLINQLHLVELGISLIRAINLYSPFLELNNLPTLITKKIQRYPNTQGKP